MSEIGTIAATAATNIFKSALGSESKEGVLHSFTVSQPTTGSTNSIAKAGALAYHVGTSDDGIPAHSISTTKKRSTRKSTKSKFAKKGVDDEDDIEEVEVDEATQEEAPRLYSGQSARSTVQISKEAQTRGGWTIN